MASHACGQITMSSQARKWQIMASSQARDVLSKNMHLFSTEKNNSCGTHYKV